MGAGADIAAGIVSGLGGLIGSIYNIWSNERDFDYQKSLQNEVFNREDNSVQRRMEDLKAAGLNPNLAAGSGAGAGAVVGRSNTPNVSLNSIGAALDAASHVQQIRAQRLQNQILQNEKDISDYNADLKRYDYGVSKLNAMAEKVALYQQLGIKDMQLRFDDKGNASLWSPNFYQGTGNNYKIDLEDSPLMQQLRWQVQNNKNAADLLQKDVNWYTADKVMDGLGAGIQLFSGFGSGYNNIKRGNSYRR